MSVVKSRVPNFSKSETELLSSLVRKYASILECKKTDLVNNKLKEETWGKLAEEFNSLSAVTYRTDKTLRAKYENIKKNAKSKYGSYRRSLYATGGGPPPLLNLTQEEEIVMELSGTSVTGLPPRNDCDKITSEENVVDLIEGNENSNKIVVEEIKEGDNYSKVIIADRKDTTHTPTTPTSSKFILKRKKAAPLTSRRNPEVYNKTMSEYGTLATKKMKLLDIQIDSLQAKIKQDQKEHDLKCTLLQLEIDIKKKELENK